MKKFKFAMALVAVLAFVLAACGSTPNVDRFDGRGGGASSSADLTAGDATSESQQSDKAFNVGGSYLGDSKQMTSSIYGARKSSTPSWGGTVQAGLIQGSQSAKEVKESLKAAMVEDPVLLGLVRRQEILLEQMGEATPEAAVGIQAQLDALVPMLETAMERIHESVRVASGADFRSLKAIVVGSISHNGNRVGADPLAPGAGEFDAYGKGFESLPKVLEALMKD